MRKSLVAASAFTMLIIMTGCQHRKAVVTVPPPPPQPPIEHPVAIPHATLADMPMIGAPVPPTVVLGGAVEPAPPQHDLQPQSPQPAEAAKGSQTDAERSAAAGEEPPTTTPIGQLSAAPNTQGLPSGKNIANEIQWIQRQLKNIHHALNAKQQRTESQIQTFLAKASNALQAGDLDGAHTLTVKARVLLGEIQ